MREIKFRGKRLDNGEWVYGYAVFGRNNTLSWIINEGYEATYGTQPDQNIFRVDPENVGQYTGLKDKNGVEIFLGDIVKTNAGSIRAVEWDQAGFWLKDTDMPLYEHHDLCEAIGNIWENPELLWRNHDPR